MRYELIRLDRLTKVYIPIFSSLTEEDALQLAEEKFLQWERQVMAETENIKSDWRVVASKRWSEIELQRYINCREEGLLALVAWSNTMQPAFKKVLNPCLEELLFTFVRLFPIRHFCLGRLIPLHVLDRLQQECSILYQQCRAGLKAQGIPVILLEAILRPLKKIAYPEPEEPGIGFDRLLFLLRLQTVLGKQLQLSYNHPDPGIAIIRSLCYINFNAEEVTRRIEDFIRKRLAQLDEVFAEKRFLEDLLIDLTTINILPDSIYEHGSRPLYRTLREKTILLVEERQEAIAVINGSESLPTKDEPMESSVIKLAMTLEELGLFFRLKAAASGIRLRKKTLMATFRLMACFMQTADKGVFTPFSPRSLAQKFYTVSDSAVKSTGDLLKRMMRNLKEIEKCKRHGLPLPKVKYY